MSNRQHADRSWTVPLYVSATKPRHWLWMDRRILFLVGVCIIPAVFAPDWRIELLFCMLTGFVVAVGMIAWRLNPYLIDELGMEVALPPGGDADAPIGTNDGFQPWRFGR